METFRAAGPTLAFPESVLIPSAAAGLLVGMWLVAPDTRIGIGVALLGGLAAWTLAEYVLHRFILHGLEPFRGWHRDHHAHPDVPMRTPVLFSLILVSTLLGVPLAVWPDLGEAAAFACGLLLGHVTQEAVHYRLHCPRPAGHGWLAARWRYHDFHHRGDEKVAFGTLSAVWDHLLGTLPHHRSNSGQPAGDGAPGQGAASLQQGEAATRAARVQFNHTIVHARDGRASAVFLAEVLGLAAPVPFGPFWVVQVDNGVSLDFRDSAAPIASQHYAFLIDEARFDAVLARIRERALPFWASPDRSGPGEINHGDGGRGMYFEDPDGHFLEVLTRPYGSSRQPPSGRPAAGP